MTNDELIISVYELLSNSNSKNLSEFIDKKLNELQISQRQFCDSISIQRRSLQRLLEGEAQKVDAITLLKISQFFDVDIKELVGIFLTGASKEEKTLLEKSKINGYLIRNFDLKSLKSMGFIKDINDLDKASERICSFFNISNIYQYDALLTSVLFSRTKNSNSDKMLRFWISIVKRQFEQINNPNRFDKEKAMKVIPKLRTFTLDTVNGFNKFIAALYDCGITVIYESYITKTQVRGGTFIFNKNPSIVLTDLNKRYDTMWFALAHELCHVIADYDLIESSGYHLSGEEDIFSETAISEERADTFARKLLLADEKVDHISKFIDSDILVEQYAKKWGVHPSVIYGHFLWKNDDKYALYRKKILNSNVITKNMEIKPWKHETISETVQLIKSKILQSAN